MAQTIEEWHGGEPFGLQPNMSENGATGTPQSPPSLPRRPDEIRPPEPARSASGEIRRVLSLGSLPSPSFPRKAATAVRVGVAARFFSTGSRNVALPSIPPTDPPVIVSEAPTTPPAGRSPSPNSAQPSVAQRLGNVLRQSSSESSLPPSPVPQRSNSSRRTSFSQPRASIPNEGRDSVAEAAAALLAQEDDDGTPMANRKRNADFHELFPTLPRDELLVEDYSCAWHKEVLIQGRLYLSQGHVNFYANLLGWVHSVEIPFSEIISIEKKNVAAIIPNSIEITTITNNKFFFASFLHRESTYSLIMSLWDSVANKTIQLLPITKVSEGPCSCPPEQSCELCAGLRDFDRKTNDRGNHRGRDMEILESMNLRRSMSLDWLRERADSQELSKSSLTLDATNGPEGISKDTEPNDDKESGHDNKDRGKLGQLSPETMRKNSSGGKERSLSLPETILREQVKNLTASTVVSKTEDEPKFPEDFVSPIETVLSSPLTPAAVRQSANLQRESQPRGLAELADVQLGQQSESISPKSKEMSSLPKSSDENLGQTIPPPLPAKNQHIVHQKIHIHTQPHIHIPHRKSLHEEAGSKHRKRNRKRPKSVHLAPSLTTPATCPCEADHKKSIMVLDAVFECSVKRLWDLLYEYGSTREGFLRSFLEGRRKCREFKMCDWVAADVDLADPTEDAPKSDTVQYDAVHPKWHRKVEYIVPLSNSLGPKQTRCKLHETVLQKDKERHICLNQISQTPDVPSGNAFQSRARLCLTSVKHRQTRLRVSCEVEWLKSSWLKAPINSAVPEGLKSYHAELETALKEYILAHPESHDDKVGANGHTPEESEEEYENDGEEVDLDDGYGPDNNNLAHPLERELAEAERFEQLLRKRRGYAQAPQRGLFTLSPLSSPPGLKFSTPTEGTFMKPFVRPAKKQPKFGGREFRRAWGVVWRSLSTTVGLAVVVSVLILFAVMWWMMFRTFVKWEVERVVSEAMSRQEVVRMFGG
ncbi:uncharacterized protein SPPG_04251 [Spizellomyces punctatus DAOM BR117]|uniref:VASt domain-containing protein n=1 Tax=Spizellomyces punctatus (strain DAOM BR117) TaxID=645134 RepID=A0A0L0HJV2_SPIPD|nr:uncharacterized protein SPPG_04251 [Spizellomyces punctatus DAOM BR117]KND01160.1 hypothetical protein SPPG_04251 [Spizellomyces punctatus DAOM BR117]|eukprot:XP_016609199.1 hypothetical protein SPPG_04251 [Spizellomyces punctatus DAOM BR117]